MEEEKCERETREGSLESWQEVVKEELKAGRGALGQHLSGEWAVCWSPRTPMGRTTWSNISCKKLG